MAIRSMELGDKLETDWGFSGEIGVNLEGSLNYGYSYCYTMIKGLKDLIGS